MTMHPNEKIETFDITPTWTGVMPMLIAIIRDGTPEGKKQASEELMKLAKSVDDLNAKGAA